MSKTVLVVDDEKRIVSMVKAYLLQEGYRVLTAADGREALTVARQMHPDLILLDIMMPEMGGLEFMRRYQKGGEAPILLLTAKVEEEDKVLGLDLGADDYITKPFGMRELMARVRTAFRRQQKQESQAEVVSHAGITLNRTNRIVQVAEERIELTRTEFDLLDLLISSPGRVDSRATLLQQVRDSAYDGYDRAIDLHVKNLRAKLGDNSRHPHYIETVYGVGYRFLAES